MLINIIFNRLILTEWARTSRIPSEKKPSLIMITSRDWRTEKPYPWRRWEKISWLQSMKIQLSSLEETLVAVKPPRFASLSWTTTSKPDRVHTATLWSRSLAGSLQCLWRIEWLMKEMSNWAWALATVSDLRRACHDLMAVSSSVL